MKGMGTGGAPDTKRKLYPRKRHFFVIEKYIEDAKQEEKDVPDLLEAIMRPTCLVKEELRLENPFEKKPHAGPLRRRMDFFFSNGFSSR